MDRLWSPWRYRYVSKAVPHSGCIFCDRGASANDEEGFIIARGEYNFALLNIFPYTSGHLMIAPYAHVATLEAADPATLAEMIAMARRAEIALRDSYNAPGFNIGMNVGEAAGAGIAGHIHLHVLPRWLGDANFMTTVAETRVLPEALRDSWEKLRRAWTGSSPDTSA
jgi:ATP adenylyltransferase